MTLMCAGCAASLEPPLRANLPAAPAQFGQPVTIPAPSKGMDARLYAAQARKAAVKANQRLRDDAAFYTDVLHQFGSVP